MSSTAYETSRRIRAATLLGIIVLSRPGCSSPTALNGPLEAGEWGGQHMGLVIGDTVAHAEYDCADGRIELPIVVVDGQFQAMGTHTPGRGVALINDSLPSYPAKYLGRVDGSRMVITVMLIGQQQTVGTFTLQRGQSPTVFKCL